MNTLSRAAVVAWLGLLLPACPEQPVNTTTRNLHRPGPLAMVCAARVGDPGFVTGLGPESCTRSATDAGAGAGPHGTLYGFVANTSRSEVSVFRSLPAASTAEALVDLDRRTPGFGVIPVGTFPTDLKASTDGCRVVTTNAGSCDLSIINVPSVLEFAAGNLPAPSGAAVSRLIPKTKAGAPLRAQPQELVLVPASIAAKAPTDACPVTGSYRAYVSFPRCNLVAELDLRTGKIVRGVQIRPDGTFVLADNPRCPVDCILPNETRRLDAGPRPDAPRDAGVPPPDKPVIEARPLEAGAADAAVDARGADASRPDAPAGDRARVSPLGVLPSGLALTDSGDRLYISSAGAGFVGILDINSATGAFEKPRTINLAGGPSTTRVRLSPPTRTMGRFLYAVASDRSLRFISIDLDPEKECETQLDLLAVPSTGVPYKQAGCYPVGDPSTPARRPNATGHGLTFGASVPEDVVFVQSGSCTEGGACQAPLPEAGVFPEIGPTAAPLRGIFSIAVTSDGNAYVIDVEDWNSLTDSGAGLLQRLHLPHRFRNQLQGLIQSVPDASVTSVSASTGGVPVVVSKVLDPGASELSTTPSLEGEGVFLRGLGTTVGTPWNLVYEDRLVARFAGNLSVARDSFSLVDPGVDFCASDVRATVEEKGRRVQHGDLVVMVGCKDDTECGLEQTCVKPVANPSDPGLCLDKSRSDDLFQTCTQFLRGSREYLVRRATPDTLTLDALPVEPQAVIQGPRPAGGCKSNDDCGDSFLCALADQPGRGLAAGDCFRPGCRLGKEGEADCFTATTGNTCVQPLDGSFPVCSSVPLPFEVLGSCGGDPKDPDKECRPKPDGLEGARCTSDTSCGDLALECRKATTSSEDKTCVNKGMVCASFAGLSGRCIRKSPCFTELQRYDVRAGRSFLVGSYRRRIADPVTHECTDDPSKSPLLVDRVPIGLPVYPVLLGPTCPVGEVAPLQVPTPDPCFELNSNGYVGDTLKSTTGSTPGSFVGSLDRPSTVMVRYANPDLWFSLGLSHLAVLPAGQASRDGGAAAPVFAPMPERGLTIQLDVGSGFNRLRAGIAAGTLGLPTRIIDAPDGFVYIVDTGDRSGTTGTFGQVVRIDRATLLIDSVVVR